MLTNYNIYENIKMPINLPRIIFPIMWTIIYLLIGFASYLIEIDGHNLNVYYLNIFLNLLWTPLFFGLNLRGFMIFYTILLFIVVLLNTFDFYKKNKFAGLLFIPYILWNLFAIYLVIGIYILN